MSVETKLTAIVFAPTEQGVSRLLESLADV